MAKDFSRHLRAGDFVRFNRGMFGNWQGRVVRFYKDRATMTMSGRNKGGSLVAVIKFKRKNGSVGEKRFCVEAFNVAWRLVEKGAGKCRNCGAKGHIYKVPGGRFFEACEEHAEAVALWVS